MLTMVSQLDKREFFGLPGTRGSMVDEDRLIQRLGHSKTLQGHGGCVNTLRWNLSGSILASGSDDQKVKIWRLDGSLLLTIPTGHRANVFAVEFLPVGNDQIIISAAGDHFVKMHNIETKDEPFTWSTNARVKRLATAQDDPFLFWSAAEDGYVREYDARSNEDRKLIETSASRVKSFAICQGRTEMVAVATDHSEVPIYDRRKPDVPLITCQNADDLCHDHFTYSTHVSFDHYGTECLVNQGCGPVYLFKLKNQGEPTVLEKLRDVISEKCGMLIIGLVITEV